MRFFPLIFTELVRARLFKQAGGILLVRTKFYVVFFPTCAHNAQKYKMYGILVISSHPRYIFWSSLFSVGRYPTTRFNFALNQRGEQDKTNRLSCLHNRFPETGSYKKVRYQHTFWEQNEKDNNRIVLFEKCVKLCGNYTSEWIVLMRALTC